MTTEHYEFPPEPVSLAALWFSVMGGPLAWVLHNVGTYWAATVLCSIPNQTWLIHGVTGILALVSLSTALVGWRIYDRLKEANDWPDNTHVSRERAMFMAGYGIFSGIFFLIVILAEGIPGVVIDPCLPPM